MGHISLPCPDIQRHNFTPPGVITEGGVYVVYTVFNTIKHEDECVLSEVCYKAFNEADENRNDF